MGFIGFVSGLLCGVLAVRFGTWLRRAWQRLGGLEISLLAGSPASAPRARVVDVFDEYYVRKLVPNRSVSWFREDSGEPVSVALDRRLEALLGMGPIRPTPVRALSGP
ncbi:MAG: hypothetical protein QM778_09825 [Myxococcales bacterium]